MARPKKGEEKHRSASLRFRVKEEIGAGLRDLAVSRRCSIADVAEEALAIGLHQLVRRHTKAGASSPGKPAEAENRRRSPRTPAPASRAPARP